MATITISLAAGSTTSPYYLDVNISKQLCAKTSYPPIFTPVFSLVSYTSVGENQYEAIVNVQGLVSFIPCGTCISKVQQINQNFVVPFSSTTAPSAVSVQGGTPTNTIVKNGCSNCGNVFVCDVPLSLDITVA